MTPDELDRALESGITLLWKGPREYERATGRLTGIMRRKGNVISCELTSISSTTGRFSVYYCKPEELRPWNPNDAN